MGIRTTFTPLEDQVIRDNYLQTPIKALGLKMGRSFTGITSRLRSLGLVIPIEIVNHRKQLGRFKKGCVSRNKGMKQSDYMSAEAIAKTAKTRFKKGDKPYNTKERDGIIVTRYLRGVPYKLIRVSINNWQHLSRVIWEKKYGKIPKGMILRFKDGNTLNVALKNLEIMTMKKNMQLNTIARYPKEVIRSIHLLSKLNKKINNAKK